MSGHRRNVASEMHFLDPLPDMTWPNFHPVHTWKENMMSKFSDFSCDRCRWYKPIGLGTVSGTVDAPFLRGLGLSLYPSPIKLPSCNPQRRFRDGFRRKEALSRRPRHELHA